MDHDRRGGRFPRLSLRDGLYPRVTPRVFEGGVEGAWDRRTPVRSPIAQSKHLHRKLVRVSK